MLFQKVIQASLEKYARIYLKKNPSIKVVAVAGSFGKTSTKEAIAAVLSQRFRVRMEDKRPENNLAIPLGILGVEYPNKPNSLIAWLAIMKAARKRVKLAADVDVVIQELICDKPGDIVQLTSYLRPAVTLITGITPTRVDVFGTIEAIAGELLSIANVSEQVLINREDVEGRFASMLTNQHIDTYGTTDAAEYRFTIDDFDLEKGYSCIFIAPELPEPLAVEIHAVGEHSLRSRVAAAAVGVTFGMPKEVIVSGLALSRPSKGRMNTLRGLNESIIIDDSYSSNPRAMEGALRALYMCETPARIALLGSMNDLGMLTESEHQKIGDLCDPSLLAWVITVGDAATEYIAPRARARGCQVRSFHNPLEAGAFLHQVLERQSVVLASGSGKGIYLEEALKVIVHATDENNEFVRQSLAWTNIKDKFFASVQK